MRSGRGMRLALRRPPRAALGVEDEALWAAVVEDALEAVEGLRGRGADQEVAVAAHEPAAVGARQARDRAQHPVGRVEGVREADAGRREAGVAERRGELARAEDADVAPRRLEVVVADAQVEVLARR